MSLDINTVLNNIAKNYNSSQTQKNKSTTTVDSNIFAQASAMVAEYKEKQNAEKNNESSNSSSTKICGLNFTEVANMSTSDFLKYAYANQAASGFTSNKNSSDNDENQSGSSGIKLPLIVSYKGRVVSTAGKSFMAVVAKIKAKCPSASEEKIAAELLAKYGNTSTNSTTSSTNTTGNSINISA